MEFTSVLNKTIILAVKLHEGQVDKAGQPYILHPLRVMNNINSLERKILAVLHDVKEDCEITDSQMIEYGMPEFIVHKLDLLTRKK